MMAITKLPDQERDTQLEELNKGVPSPWKIIDGKLHKEFLFADFITAFGFM